MPSALPLGARRWVSLLAVCYLLILPGPLASDQDFPKGGIDNRVTAVAFCKQFRRSVKAKDKDNIANSVMTFLLEIEFARSVYPGARHSEEKSTVLISDKQDFIEKFNAVFNDDVTRSLNSNSGCELEPNPDGSADIANGAITIDQVDGGFKTVIRWISPPKNFRELYKDQETRDIGAKNFLMELKQAITSNDPNAVAKFCSYPFHAHVGGHEIWVHDRAETVREYPLVLTDTL